MDCAKVRKHLSDYVDGLLSGRLKKSVDAHIQRCPGCREELTALKALRRKMGGLHRMSAPPDFLDRVHRRLEREGAQARKKRRRVFFLPAGVPVGIAALATAAVALLFVLNVILPRMEDRVLPVEKTAFREEVAPSGEEKAAPEIARRELEPAGPEKPESREREPEAQTADDDMEAHEPGKDDAATRSLGEGTPAATPSYGEPVELVLYVKPEGAERVRTPPAETSYERGTSGLETEKKEKGPDMRAKKQSLSAEADALSSDEAVQAPHPEHSVLLLIEHLTQDLGGEILSLDYGERADILRAVMVEIPASALDDFAAALNGAGELEGEERLRDEAVGSGRISLRILLIRSPSE